MNSDYQDWAELVKKATHDLQHKILGINPILQLIIRPSFTDDFRIDFIEGIDGRSYSLEKITWRKTKDYTRINDPLEKMSQFGNYQPTFEREYIMLNDNSALTLMNPIESIIRNKDKYSERKRPIVLDGVQHDLHITYKGADMYLDWNIMPKNWTSISRIKELLFDLTGTKT
ncbi:MAG: hypothetical protein ACI94Y_003609 [Maribacter sp.]|jgi:hypothetical protein